MLKRRNCTIVSCQREASEHASRGEDNLLTEGHVEDGGDDAHEDLDEELVALRGRLGVLEAGGEDLELSGHAEERARDGDHGRQEHLCR